MERLHSVQSVAPAEGEHTPLFTSSGSDAIQASFVRTVLHHMFQHKHMQPVMLRDRKAKNSFQSFHKFYMTGLKQMEVNNTTIQSLLRWSDPESVDEYNMPSPEDRARMVDAAYNYSHGPNAITPQILKLVKAIQIDDHDVLRQWCEHCHVDISAEDMDF